MAKHQIIPIFISAVSCVLTFATCIWNQWEVSGNSSSNLLGSTWAFRGLWEDCMQLSSGQYQCNAMGMETMSIYPIILALRCLMCTAIVCSVASIALLILTASNNSHHNKTLNNIAACLIATSGCLVLASCIWSTCSSIARYNDPSNYNDVLRYEIGAAVYLGFVTSFLLWVSSFTCCCFPPHSETVDTFQHHYQYQVENDRRRSQFVKQEYV